MQIALEGKLRLDASTQSEAEQYDVRQLKRALNRLGYYTPDSKTGITGNIDEGFKDALYAFQRKATIFLNDTDIGPDSTTERILNEELARQNDNALYIWRTVGDEKVRTAHASFEGKRFSWNNPPDGQNPGEDYNCRCWAEPLNPPIHPWIDWVKERHETREKLAQPLGLKIDPVTQQPGLDAINPTWSPFDFIAPFAATGVRSAIRIVATKFSTSEGPYEIALQGGKHFGFLKKYKDVSNKELEKGIKSFEKQINRHLEKIKNPEKEIPEFKNLDKRRQKKLLEKIWPLEIKRLKEEKEILRRILDERN